MVKDFNERGPCPSDLSSAPVSVIESRFPGIEHPMANLIFFLIVQANLVFGLAGLIWPEKFMSLYGILMFPFPASHRAIRLHGIVAICGYLLVLARIFQWTPL